MAAKTRHSSGTLLDPEIVFPMMEKFLHKGKLPTINSVLGMPRHFTGGGKKNIEHKTAVTEVVKLVYSKWYHDTVYCLSFRSMERKLADLWKDFREGKKRLAVGRGDSSKVVLKYKEMVDNADKLWDVFAADAKRFQECKE